MFMAIRANCKGDGRRGIEKYMLVYFVAMRESLALGSGKDLC
jgi:hypothetical protein